MAQHQRGDKVKKYWETGEKNNFGKECYKLHFSQFYEEDDGIIGRGMRVDFEVYVSEKYRRDFLLIYYLDKSSDTLTYQQFYEVCSDADAERMKSLGLENFVRTD